MGQGSFDKDYLSLGLAPDHTQFAFDLKHAEPIGTWWEYNNAAIQTVELALRSAVGQVIAQLKSLRRSWPMCTENLPTSR